MESFNERSKVQPEEVLSGVLAENPLSEMDGVVSEEFVKELSLLRHSYFTSYYEFFRTGAKEAYEIAEKAREEYGKAATKLKQQLGRYKGATKDEKEALLAAYVEGENKRWKTLKNLFPQREKPKEETKPKRFTWGLKSRAAAVVLAGLGVASAEYDTLRSMSPFRTEPVSASSVTPERAEAAVENVGEVYTESVRDDEGAIHTLSRILDQMDQEHKQELFAALSIDLPEGEREQADELSKRLNLLNEQGRSALIPERSSFEYDNGTLTLHTPHRDFPLIRNVVHDVEGHIVRVGTTPYNGRFLVDR